ncbi:MAG: Uma2 family endonuclease [bacterium]|nr:Uma2 family endonuclease [bacterium]
MVVQRKLYTYDEFEQIARLPENQQRRLELINGEIIEVVPLLEHGFDAGVIHGKVFIYLERNPIGRVVFEVDFKSPDDDDNAFRPDVAYISNERLAGVDPKKPAHFLPDLAVEVKSPSNYYTGKEGLREKAAYYLAHGTRLVWLVDPEKQQVEVYMLGQPPVIYTLEDTLEGGDVLPGFTLPVRSIFTTP